MDSFNRAIPQIVENYREFVQHIVNIGGEFIKLGKQYKLILTVLCINGLLSLTSIILSIVIICKMKG